MTKTELLDHFALHAMQSIIGKFENSISSMFVSQKAYSIAKDMLEYRQQILDEWDKNQKLAEGNLEKLDLPINILFHLRAEEIFTVEQLKERTPRDILKIPNMGKRKLQRIEYALADIGLKLKEQA